MTLGRARVRWIVLGAAIVSLLAMAAIVAIELGADANVDRAEPLLPEPKPPLERPLIAPDDEAIGWSWVNPTPRYMPAWLGVDVADDGRVALVGLEGRAGRFAGGSLFRWTSGTTEALRAVRWIGRSQAIVAGERGTLRILGTGDPIVLEAGTEATLRAIAIAPDGSWWVAGDRGTLLRVEGERVRPIRSGTREDLLAIHVRGREVWVTGAGGTVLRFEGERPHVERPGVDVTLRAAGGCPRTGLYVAGDGGRVLRRSSDGAWRAVSGTGDEPWASIACDGGRVVVAGRRGGVLLVSGTRSVRLGTGSDLALHAVGSAPQQRTWIAGDGGRLLVVQEDRVRLLTGGSSAPLQDATTLGGELVAVGEWGRIVRGRDGRIEELRSPTKAALAAVAPASEDRLVAIGDFGAAVEIKWDAVRLLESPGTQAWRDLVGGGGNVLGVGAGGALLRGSPDALRASRVPDVGDLWGIDGTPESAIAVGDAGTVVRISESGASRVPCELTDSLRDVVRTPDGAWAVGIGGVVARIEDARCVLERRGGPDLLGVGPGPYGRPLAVGKEGAAIQRDEQGQWVDAGLDAQGAELREVLRTDRDVWVVGAGGVIVRHPRLDDG